MGTGNLCQSGGCSDFYHPTTGNVDPPAWVASARRGGVHLALLRVGPAWLWGGCRSPAPRQLPACHQLWLLNAVCQEQEPGPSSSRGARLGAIASDAAGGALPLTGKKSPPADAEQDTAHTVGLRWCFNAVEGGGLRTAGLPPDSGPRLSAHHVNSEPY
ncbi:serine/threonine-protein kinase WNK1 [Platysternon megacephalum]|uniref:Serine/threonine-protein kinase WNK1 n=1 Tax=Platysternon megacephalum TaxID=55544 RepID=A0A4D9E0H6_9SAUR|nr:serine/threonine-protein kinase WNK1 [Platysternon megacephalum]